MADNIKTQSDETVRRRRIGRIFSGLAKKKSPDTALPLLSPRRGLRERYSYFRRDQKYLILCFCVPMAIMWLMYICRGVFPFGQESVLVLDLNGQYVYFFEGLRDILR